MTLGGLANLIVAYSDLKAVQSVTRAINANLPKTGPLGTIPAATKSLDPRPRLRGTPEAEFDRRQISRPEAELIAAAERAAERVDRYEPCGCGDRPTIELVVAPAYNHGHSPIRPIWATLPPVPHVTAERVVKVVHQKVDLQSRGTVLDIFV